MDLSQTLGQLPIDVGAIGCDIAFAPGRKFLRAPRGTAVLYVEAALAGQLVPLSLPFGVVDPADLSRYTLPSGLRRLDQFEYGVAGRLGLAEAARYALALGLDRIAATIADRSRAVIDLLSTVDGVHPHGHHRRPRHRVVRARHAEPRRGGGRLSPEPGSTSWVNPTGGAPYDAAARPVLPSVRLSPHYVTSDDDLDRLATALEKAGSPGPTEQIPG